MLLKMDRQRKARDEFIRAQEAYHAPITPTHSFVMALLLPFTRCLKLPS